MMDLMTTTPFYHINTTDATGRNGSMYEDDEEYDYRDEHAELRQSLNVMSTTIGVPIATSLAFLNSCLNPLLYVFMGQDFKDKVRKSILNVLETAFQEEVSRSYICTNSMITSRSKEKSVSDTEGLSMR